MATGMAKGAKARGKRIAFGDGSRIIWDQYSEQIFRGNPNIAPPGSEVDGSKDLEWIPYYKGNRIYNKHDHVNDKWIWNQDFRPIPGEMFFNRHEKEYAQRMGKNFVVIEPHVPYYKGSSPNKSWSFDRYTNITQMLRAKGIRVIQFRQSGAVLPGAVALQAPSFRHVLSALGSAIMYIGPEGGMHHGAAAVGIPAVVLFGGFVPPSVTGYDSHVNITGGAKACGSLSTCSHCIEVMNSIKTKHVWSAVKDILECSTSSVGSGDQSGRITIPNVSLHQSSAT
jgi:hypothetical protein